MVRPAKPLLDSHAGFSSDSTACRSPSQALVSTGWTLGSWVPILSQALGGIVVGHITKRLGGISKGFAVVCGLIVTGALQMIADGKPLSAELAAALVLVACRYVQLACVRRAPLMLTRHNERGATAVSGCI